MYDVHVQVRIHQCFFPDHVNFYVLHMYMYISYMYISTCTDTCTSVYVQVHVLMYRYMYISTCTDVHVSVHIYTDVHVHVSNMKIYMIRKKKQGTWTWK
jgi:hypothetical protein